MGSVWWFLAIPLGVAAVWAILAPRNQWRSLFSWSVANAHSSEPGGAAYAYRQIIAGIALGLSLLMVVLAMAATASRAPQEASRIPDIELMWGSPAPLLAYRAFKPAAAPDSDLVDVPIESYLPVNDNAAAPLYLLDLERFSRLGTTNIPGYIGSEPDDTDSTIGRADVLLHVRGPLLCIPRRVVVVEDAQSVQIAVQYGLPTSSDPSKSDNEEACLIGEDLTASVLIPVTLNDVIGERSVEGLDGTPLTLLDTTS
ncbi:fumarate hydratase [Salinibacterium sp. NK8237]|uniref:fumarate hydratase n=1 Tax=Salinibacterium sp. NK8237 TaxID=2792038 RepID=UPI0018CED676|nr:fumarate hydratase [Salinibacterium sp. NK8237]MBH0131199.1 fumarate hydratase [Salinibacterium sp. NK8237]